MLILVLTLFFAGCATQKENVSTHSAKSPTESPAQSAPQSMPASGGEIKGDTGSEAPELNEGDTGPDAPDSEIVWGPHK